MRDALARLSDVLAESGRPGALLLYDEAHLLADDRSRERYPLSSLLAALGAVQRTGEPHVRVVLTGLPTLILAVDISMVGYLVGPRPGALIYNLAHNWAAGVAVLALAWWLGSPAIGLIGAILVAHTGMDRAAGYGLKYPTAFADTHLGRLGRQQR